MYRETTKKIDQAEAVSIQLNRFEPKEGMAEYQLLLSGTDPTLPFTEQAEHLWQAYIRVMREELADTEARRWAVSEEDIAAYRELAPQLIVADSADFLSSSTDGANEASKLMQRYMDEQIGAEQFIRELDRIIQMMQMENY